MWHSPPTPPYLIPTLPLRGTASRSRAWGGVGVDVCACTSLYLLPHAVSRLASTA